VKAYLRLKPIAESPEDPEAYARFVAEHPGSDAWQVALPALMLLSIFVTALWLSTRPKD
jgi:hypothetical protein